MSTDMNRVASIILGGGQGTRLFPLTHDNPKPAIPFGGRYRLIDVPVSNSINSQIRKIFIITQFLSSALHRHLMQTYRFDNFSSGFIELLSPEQRPSGEKWFQGTADAVRQNIHHFEECPVDYFLILSGDQLYNIQFDKMIDFARKKDADLVIAALPVNKEDAMRMGLLQIDDYSSVFDFYEKPKQEEVLQRLTIGQDMYKKWNFPYDGVKNYLGSMGIYVFKREALLRLLQEDKREDFGKHLIPTQIQMGNVFAYLYNGYWEDIGTIDAFYKANIALTQANPIFDCYDASNTIYSYMQNLPGSKFMSGKSGITHSIICDGCVIEAEEITNSILGFRSVIKKGTIIRDSYIMGSDFYDPPVRVNSTLPDQLNIGEDCTLIKCIVDRNVHIGKGVKLVNAEQLDHYNGDHIYIRDGIILVTRGANIPDGFTL